MTAGFRGRVNLTALASRLAKPASLTRVALDEGERSNLPLDQAIGVRAVQLDPDLLDEGIQSRHLHGRLLSSHTRQIEQVINQPSHLEDRVTNGRDVFLGIGGKLGAMFFDDNLENPSTWRSGARRS